MHIGNKLDYLNNKIKVNLAMPGHKGKINLNTEKDMTELPGLDNLSNPQEVILKSQKWAADIYGVSKFRYLVNGSSCGNLTMIFSFLKEGDKVLVERNCHKSIYNAIILRKLIPVYIYKKNQDLPLTLEDIVGFIKKDENKNIKALIVTNPGYFGYIGDHEGLYLRLKENGIKFLVDGAHGAHLIAYGRFSDFYRNCDAMTVSFHKTLSAINQSAALLYNDPSKENEILFYSNMFQSTSPSYLMLESMEKSLMDIAEGIVGKDFLLEFKKFFSKDPLKNIRVEGMDPTKVILHSDNNGECLFSYLMEQGIFCEMYNSDNVLLMFSYKNTEEEVKYVMEVIKNADNYLSMIHEKSKSTGIKAYPRTEYVLSPSDAVMGLKEDINLSSALGRISADYITPYPPGIPLTVPGERISADIIEYIFEYKGKSMEIQGFNYGKIKVLKEEI